MLLVSTESELVLDFASLSIVLFTSASKCTIQYEHFARQCYGRLPVKLTSLTSTTTKVSLAFVLKWPTTELLTENGEVQIQLKCSSVRYKTTNTTDNGAQTQLVSDWVVFYNAYQISSDISMGWCIFSKEIKINLRVSLCRTQCCSFCTGTDLGSMTVIVGNTRWGIRKSREDPRTQEKNVRKRSSQSRRRRRRRQRNS
jgi:hypothetical protein